jgi:hypothetical protein
MDREKAIGLETGLQHVDIETDRLISRQTERRTYSRSTSRAQKDIQADNKTGVQVEIGTNRRVVLSAVYVSLYLSKTNTKATTNEVTKVDILNRDCGAEKLRWAEGRAAHRLYVLMSLKDGCTQRGQNPLVETAKEFG